MHLIPRNHHMNFDSLFGDFFPGIWRAESTSAQDNGATAMRIDVHDIGEAYEVHAELPGVKKKDIEITLSDGILTISATKNTEAEKKEKGRVVWRERSSGEITRSFSVPAGTNQKDIKAAFNDGVLTLTVARKNGEESSGKMRRIAIK